MGNKSADCISRTVQLYLERGARQASVAYAVESTPRLRRCFDAEVEMSNKQ